MFYNVVYGTSEYLFCMYLHWLQSISDFFFFFGESDLGFPFVATKKKNRKNQNEQQKPTFWWMPDSLHVCLKSWCQCLLAV